MGDPRFTVEGEPIDIVTTDREEYQALRVELARLGVPADVVWDLEEVSEREVRLSWEGRGIRLVRTFTAGEGPYQLYTTTELTNTSERAKRTRLEVGVWHYVRREDEGGGGFLGIGARSPKISHATCVYDDEAVRVDRGALAPDDGPPVPHGYGAGDVHFAAVEDAYFVQAAAADGEQAARCGLRGDNRGACPEAPTGRCSKRD
ncbi:MAG: hypothetical protein M5U28_07970 [Sandaracinaceae bacterium]|nr:hypothetical protein [Sandaracinaceae bacterium]